MSNDFAWLIDRLAAAFLEAKGLVSDLHAAVKDARACLKDIAAERERVESMVRRAVEEEIREEAQTAFESLIPECKQALDVAVKHVLKEFRKIERAILTGGRHSRFGDLRDLVGVEKDTP